MQFNLCMEPWLKYAMHLVADQGLQRSQWTSARLLGEVLYVETNRGCVLRGWPPGLLLACACITATGPRRLQVQHGGHLSRG